MEPLEVLLYILLSLCRLMDIAIFIRVLLSWVALSGDMEDNPFANFIFQITEPVLGPLREFITPYFGMIDLSPIAAWLILMILQTTIENML